MLRSILTIELFFVLALLAILNGTALAGDTISHKPYIELTESPISAFDSVQPSDLSVLGVRLGMSQIGVKKLIAGKSKVYLRQDKFYDSRIYLYEYQPGKVDQQPLAYFKWEKDDRQSLKEIILYPRFAHYMPKENDYLVTSGVMPGLGKKDLLELGKIQSEESLLELPSQDIYHTAFYFLKPGFRVIKQVKGERVQFTFSWFKASAEGKPLTD